MGKALLGAKGPGRLLGVDKKWNFDYFGRRKRSAMKQGGNASRILISLLASISMTVLFLGGRSDKGSSPTSPNTSPQTPAPTTDQDVSFESQIIPVFQRYGCAGCHGGSGGLFAQTVPQLLQGGLHGPAVIPGKADSSNIVRKISPSPPFGDRMPQGGPYLPDSTIQLIRLWINQGAKNN